MHLGERGHEVIIPADRESDFKVEGLPGHHADGVIAAAVNRALWQADVLHQSDYHDIDVIVSNSIVSLKGHVVTGPLKSRAAQTARTVPGVLGVENHLISDEEVVMAVAQALEHDARTREQTVYVNAHNGLVSLNGEVSSARIRTAIEECAAGVPIVRGILNYVKAPNVVRNDADQRVLQPSIGTEINALDIRVGKVAWVIINPLNRRVTAIVAHGPFPDLAKPDSDPALTKMPQRAQHVVIPMTSVRGVTVGGVLLRISSSEAARLTDFNPDHFVTPDVNWRPPYPYHLADVMFEREEAPRANC